jgi:hypothetical protein
VTSVVVRILCQFHKKTYFASCFMVSTFLFCWIWDSCVLFSVWGLYSVFHLQPTWAGVGLPPRAALACHLSLIFPWAPIEALLWVRYWSNFLVAEFAGSIFFQSFWFGAESVPPSRDSVGAHVAVEARPRKAPAVLSPFAFDSPPPVLTQDPVLVFVGADSCSSRRFFTLGSR